MPSIKTNSGWATEDPIARYPSAREAIVPFTSNLAGIELSLLAQIPDLDAEIADDEAEDPNEGRIISQSLSNKLVLGGGFLLVVAAILPFTMGKKAAVKPVANELPAWHSEGAAPVNGAVPISGPQLGAPGAVSAPAPGTTYEASQATPPTRAYLAPQPQVGTNRPMALGDPAWPQSAQAEANRAQSDPRQGHPADYRVGDPPQTRRNDGGPDPQNYQADRRNDPANDYRSSYRDDSRSDYRNDSRSDYRNDYPGTGSLQGNPLMPSTGPGASPASVQDPQASEPGVARFEGTIAKPPVRTNYDRAGSSTN